MFIYKKHFCNNLVVDSLVATFFSKIVFPRQLFFLKLLGRIKSFASRNIAVTKWRLNRGDQAKNMSASKQLAGIEKITEVNKSLRHSQKRHQRKKFKK